jgi:UPF0755 protein
MESKRVERKSRGNCFGLVVLGGVLAVILIVAIIVGSSLIARAEAAFGPPADALNGVEAARLGIQLGWQAEALTRPVDAEATAQAFSIPLDEPTAGIVARLQAEGLVRDAALFSDYLVYTGLDTQLQAGEFELSAAMNTPQLAAALLDPTPGTITLTIFPGWRLEEVADAILRSGLELEAAALLEALSAPYPEFAFLADRPAGFTLEGYLLPGDYEIEREATPTEIVLQILSAGWGRQVGQEILEGFAAQGLDIHEGVTLASIVAREGVVREEMPLIASVFLNRLERDMRLEADPTVQYALGYDTEAQSWWTNPLLTGHLSTDSPYNTYLHAGLPPGPIANPGLTALRAVADPAQSDYLFFQAVCDGSGAHVFAYTFEEHVGNNCP